MQPHRVHSSSLKLPPSHLSCSRLPGHSTTTSSIRPFPLHPHTHTHRHSSQIKQRKQTVAEKHAQNISDKRFPVTKTSPIKTALVYLSLSLYCSVLPLSLSLSLSL